MIARTGRRCVSVGADVEGGKLRAQRSMLLVGRGVLLVEVGADGAAGAGRLERVAGPAVVCEKIALPAEAIGRVLAMSAGVRTTSRATAALTQSRLVGVTARRFAPRGGFGP